MKRSGILSACALLPSTAYATPISSRHTSLPTVDLGYEIHQAISFNDTAKYYSFSNIPFAAPPLGDLRFAAPQPPLQGDCSAPTVGSGPRICPQATTGWTNITSLFFFQYAGLLATGETSDIDSLTPLTPSQLTPFSYSPQEGESEDCLYLDVVVPEEVFDCGAQAKAPVLVEIFGGGYVRGDKVAAGKGQGEGSPAGLIKRSNDSIVYVALNYRLGAFGWLAGPDFESQGGKSNAGLLDQRMALEWVQKYIHLFGGDPEQVTVLGESAGGGSIEHQITAYGGMKGRSPFKRAIPQSPGFTPMRWNNYTDQTFHAFMGVYANVSSLAELRNLDSVALMEANAHQVFDTQIIGSFTYGPVVDGDFVPDLPGVLFASGRFDQGVEVMAGHNAREGGFFTDPTLRNDSELIRQIETALGASPQVAEYIASELYPAIYNGTQPYGNWYERAMLITTEFAFICNNFYMLSATGSQSYGYLFNVFPGFHGQDVAYTFYAGTDPTNATSANFQDFVQVQYPDAAYTLQDWIVTFAMGSSPLTIVPGSPNLPLYDGGGQIGTLNGAAGMFAASLGKEPADNERCRWWQQGLYAPPL